MPAGARSLPGMPRPAGKGRTQVRHTPPADFEAFAHDLRNILSSVRGCAQLLSSLVDDEKAAEYLAIIEAESGKCCDLIERMLMPTELTVGSASQSDAARAAQRACELARGDAALKGIEVTCEAEGELPPAAIPQEDLERVLLNLLRNGVQATPRGGRVEARVRNCRFDGSGDGVEIEVTDTGRGIPGPALKMIFEPFFSTHSPGEGVGLGLTICSALIRRCGGSIRVESEEGAATTFTVRLPVRT